MSNEIEKINAEIIRLKNSLSRVKGTVTEVYTRIVGYYRALKNWNPGRRAEYSERKNYILKEDKNNANKNIHH